MTNDRSTAKGETPNELPTLLQEYYDMEKKSVEALVEGARHVSSVAGIGMFLYAGWLHVLPLDTFYSSQVIVSFLPLLALLLSTVFAIAVSYPRRHVTESDYDRKNLVLRIRRTKLVLGRLVLWCFLVGLMTGLYAFMSYMFQLTPFSCEQGSLSLL